jgi:hypothetical protein
LTHHARAAEDDDSHGPYAAPKAEPGQRSLYFALHDDARFVLPS